MSDTQSVVVTDLNISFSLMVILLVKFALASIHALLNTINFIFGNLFKQYHLLCLTKVSCLNLKKVNSCWYWLTCTVSGIPLDWFISCRLWAINECFNLSTYDIIDCYIDRFIFGKIIPKRCDWVKWIGVVLEQIVHVRDGIVY